MDMILVVMGIMTGALLLSGVLSLFLAFKNYEKPFNVSYFFLSIFLIADVWSAVLRYNASSLSQWIAYEKFQNTSLILIGYAFIYFFAFLTKNYSQKKILPHLIILSVFFIVNILSPYGIAYSKIISIEGSKIAIYGNLINGEPSIANYFVEGYLAYLVYFIASTLWNVIVKKGDKALGVFLIIAIGLTIISIWLDLLLIFMRIINMPFLEIIGLSVFVIIVTKRNYDNVFDTAKIKGDLLEIEKRYRTLIEYSPDGIIVHDRGEVLYSNANAKIIAGTYNCVAINRNVFDFILPEYLQISKTRCEEIVNEKKILFAQEIKIKKYTGEIIDVEVSSVPVTYGKIKAVQTIVRDITKAKEAEIELLKLSRAVEQSSVAMYITNIHSVIEYVNPKFEEITGYKSGEVLGQKVGILLAERIPDSIYEKMRSILYAGQTWSGELLNRKKSGETFWGKEIISTIKNSKGGITHFVAMKEDITAAKKMMEELIKAKEEAEQANRVKTSLLSNVSHEFRTPLNGILGYAQILTSSVTDKSIIEMAEKINSSGNRLLNTLNSVLFLTEIENRTFVLSEDKIELTGFIRRMRNNYKTTVVAKKLEYYTSLPNEKIWTITDETLLTRALSAIIENAIKYTNTGSIRIVLEKGVTDNIQTVSIKVIDTGIGISPENQKIIFNEFKQVSEGYSRAYEGLGLGLSLANKMVNLMEGTIFVESKLNQGSVFTITLPLKDVENGIVLEEKNAMNIVLDVNTVPRVLLVEDNNINIEVAAHYLQDSFKLSSSLDGATAIKMAKEQKYDVLMLDINLGGGFNGIETLKEIRKIEGYEYVPAIAITGYASTRNKKDFTECGFDEILVKPYNRSELIDRINTVLFNGNK